LKLFHNFSFSLGILTIASFSSLADDGLLNCFEAAEYTSEAMSVCSSEMSQKCILSGTDPSGSEAEIACFQQYEQAVRGVARQISDQYSTDPSEIRAGLKSAAFRRSFRVAEATCDYFEEIILLGREDERSASNDASYSSCMANSTTTIFWLIAVHEKLDFGRVE